MYAFLFLHFLKDDGHENNDIYLEICIYVYVWHFRKFHNSSLYYAAAIRYKGRKTSIINTTFELFFSKKAIIFTFVWHNDYLLKGKVMFFQTTF